MSDTRNSAEPSPDDAKVADPNSDDPRAEDTSAKSDNTGVEHSDAPIDQISDQPQAGDEQNPPLPDYGPTDGIDGTDASAN